VGGEHHGLAARSERAHRDPERAPAFDVHRDGRLVEDQELGIADHGDREAGALCLATGKLLGALLRRAQIISDHRQTIGGTVMECDSLTVITPEGSTVLPQKEFMLLYKMASFPGKTFTRQQLMDDIWGYESDSDSHTVEVHIGRLRERFRDSKDFKIVTMRGLGYKVVKL
jgi:hypothetical protein